MTGLYAKNVGFKTFTWEIDKMFRLTYITPDEAIGFLEDNHNAGGNSNNRVWITKLDNNMLNMYIATAIEDLSTGGRWMTVHDALDSFYSQKNLFATEKTS